MQRAGKSWRTRRKRLVKVEGRPKPRLLLLSSIMNPIFVQTVNLWSWTRQELIELGSCANDHVLRWNSWRGRRCVSKLAAETVCSFVFRLSQNVSRLFFFNLERFVLCCVVHSFLIQKSKLTFLHLGIMTINLKRPQVIETRAFPRIG